MAYFGCRTCCNKLLWCFLVLFIVGAAALLAAGLYKTIPCTQGIIRCTKSNTVQDNGKCWQEFWACNNNGLHFILSCAGVASLLLALLCLCVMCCASSPGAKERKRQRKEQERLGQHDQGQFIQSTPVDTNAPATTYATNDTGAAATYPDQYAAYNPNYGTKGSNYA